MNPRTRASPVKKRGTPAPCIDCGGPAWSTRCRSCDTASRQPTTQMLAARLWASIAQCGHEDCPYCCWEWQGRRNKQGYGVFDGHKRPKGAHRALYQILNHCVLPSTIGVLHHCDNPPCCNPWHLFRGTSADNSHDAARKGRYPQTRIARETLPHIFAWHASGMSQRAIARHLGVSKTHIRRILAGLKRQYG